MSLIPSVDSNDSADLNNESEKNSTVNLNIDLNTLAKDIKAWGKSLGFQAVGITDLDIGQHKDFLKRWLENGYQGDMSFFERNLDKRLDPESLVPGSVRIISVRMDYLPEEALFASTLKDSSKAFISRYALGRDYHKVMRKRLKQLGEKIQDAVSTASFRPFVDSAPVLEHTFAQKAGIGWTGKHSLTINESTGSWFFLGELFINLPLPVDEPSNTEGCGSCKACRSMCPTDAIVEDYVIDAKRCISYLTIEHDGVIPEEFRVPMGNRIYGCDDCQLACPYNKESTLTSEDDFSDRFGLKNVSLLTLFNWSEKEFLSNLEGSPIRRIGHIKWLRNISIGLANGPATKDVLSALNERLSNTDNDILIEHFTWAINHLSKKLSANKQEIPIRLDESMTRQQARLIRSIEKGMPRDA